MAGHGGNIYEIERKVGVQKERIVDFSSNINPLGLNKKLIKSIKKNVGVALRYPDIEYHDLVDSISENYKIDRGFIIPGNGATEILSLYFKVLSPKKALILSPTFSEYERALRINGCEIKYFKLEENSGFVPVLSDLCDEMKGGYDVVVMCNPNNPTGMAVGKGFAEELSNVCAKTGGRVFIDESFMDFLKDADEYTAAGLTGKHENLFILKSLTKFFAIPGIRLGFGMTSDTDLLARMKNVHDPWSINCFADLAGRTLLGDKKYISGTKKTVMSNREMFFKELNEIKNIKVFESCCNFLLIKLLDNMNVSELQDRMLKDRILIRDCSNFKYLDKKFFRVAVKTKKQNSLFVNALVRNL